MKFVIDESLNVFSQLLFPICLVIIPGILQMAVRIYLSFHEKNKYRKLLTANFPEVKTFLNRVNWFKITHVYFLGFIAILFGIISGELFEILFLYPSYSIFMKMLDLNFIANFLSSKLNLNLLSMDMIGFNLAMIYTSLLTQFFIIVIYILLLWFVLINRMGMLPVKIEETGYTTPKTMIVYESVWFFIEFLIGLNYFIYRLIFHYLSEFSIITGDFSFNFSYFTVIYTNLSSNLMYPAFHIFMHLTGILASCTLIVLLYFITKVIAERVIELITRRYEYKFPYVKITTGNGETEGRLKDFRNKSLMSLSGKDELKIIPWDKIETMNAKFVKKSEQFIFNNK